MNYHHNSTQALLRNTDTALDAIRRGFQPVPLVSGDKKSRTPGWSRLRWENTPEGLEEARRKFEDWADAGHGGIGVLLGEPSGGLVDIDLDSPKALRLKDHFLPATPARSGRDSRPGTHYWYIAKPGTLQESRTFKFAKEDALDTSQMIVEYRSTGGQTALPGNVHPSGDKYTWAGEPWGGSGPALVDGRVLLVQTALLGLATLLVNSWPSEGGRHDAYLALAGGLLRVGDGVHPYWERNIRVLISAIADVTRDEDGAEQRVEESVGTTLKRLREGKPAAGFGKLSEILGEATVKQARVILAEVESAAGLPARTSDAYRVETIAQALPGTSTPATTSTAPISAADRMPDVEDGSDVPPEEMDPLEARAGTWEALDLDPYITGQVQPVVPTILERSDGQALFYPGRLNMLYGPSESAKSWIAMYTCIQLMERGERVIYLDFEDEPVNAIQRMRLLGAAPDDLRKGFKYVRPEDPLAHMQRDRWGNLKTSESGLLNQRLFQELLDSHDPALVVADGMTVLYSLHGLDTNDSAQTDVITGWLKSLTRGGRSTAIVVDHTAKNPQRGSLPIGSQHKVSMVQGTLLQAFPVRQPMPGDLGEVELIVLKDRPGQVRAVSTKSGEKAQSAARLFIDSRKPEKAVVTLVSPEAATPSKNSKESSNTQVEIDLRHQRAAERAAQVERENAQVMHQFGGKVGTSLTMSEILEGIYSEKVSTLTPAQRNAGRRGVKRLLESGYLTREGSTKGTMYVLTVADL